MPVNRSGAHRQEWYPNYRCHQNRARDFKRIATA